MHTNFEINNKGIQILLSKRILTYALEVQCVSTWFRKLYTIHENRVIRLDPQMIHERVELIPCIVVATSIEGFTNEDFAEEYQDMKFDLNAGDIIGIGQKRTFDALYQNDIIKNGSSIVDVGGNDKLKEIQCDFSQSTIKLTLPADQYENYRSCGYNRSKYKMLNAILIVPALVEAIGIIAADEKDPEHQSGKTASGSQGRNCGLAGRPFLREQQMEGGRKSPSKHKERSIDFKWQKDRLAVALRGLEPFGKRT